MPEDRIRELLDKLLRDGCTPVEKEELFLLVEQVDDQPELRLLLENAWSRYDMPTHSVPGQTAESILQFILGDGKTVKKPVVRQMPLWRRSAIAAAVLLAIGLGSYFLFFRQKDNREALAQIVFPNDIKAPEKSKATITLANGQQLVLDSLHNGQFSSQGHVKLIRKPDGAVFYEAMAGYSHPKELLNTFSNPRGSQVAAITLSDGTKVWLNAGSTLSYPVAFTGKDRVVTITGEAYFEVTHFDHWPFKVNKDATQVTVLGTRFNVMAYDDEKMLKITLVQGSVRVSSNTKSGTAAEHPPVVLTPGEQAQISPFSPSEGSPRIRVQTADTEQAIAWKEGLFDYRSTDLTQVLREAGRWYDIDITYEGKIPGDTFTGGIQRTATLSELLTILQMSRVHFRLEGRKLTVLNS
jgi:transmembrane sensor